MKRPPVLAHRNFQKSRNEISGRGELRDKFSFIYETNLWGAEETKSGLGSSPDATRHVRAAIKDVCEKYEVRTLLDLPCGDVSWIHLAKLPIESYVGGDIVPEIVERNRQREDLTELGYAVRFERMDLRRYPLSNSDLVLCRDCLVHLSFANCKAAVRNIVKSKSRYLLTTTFSMHDDNQDIEDGDWRLLNLERAPFNFPKPLAVYNEGCDEQGSAYADKSLGLWRVENLAEGLE